MEQAREEAKELITEDRESDIRSIPPQEFSGPIHLFAIGYVGDLVSV